MTTDTDCTPEIFAALGVTPGTQPWAYYVDDGERVWNLDEFLKWYSMNDADYYPHTLLSGALEADGLAVRLVEMARQKALIPSPEYALVRLDKQMEWCVGIYEGDRCKINTSFAHAVHDALVEALGIKKATQ